MVGSHPVAHIGQLFVPGGHSDVLRDALNRLEGRVEESDAVSAARGVFEIIAASDRPDSPVVIRGDRYAVAAIAPAIAEACAKRGVGFVNALGHAALSPDLTDYILARETSLTLDELFAYCATDSWPEYRGDDKPE